MEFIKVEDGKIVDYISTSTAPEGDEYIEMNDATFEGFVGQNLDRIDLENGGKMKTEEQLLEEGIIEDNRGTYYNTANGKALVISDLDQAVPEGYTAEIPEGDYPKWTGEEWVDAGTPPATLFSPIWDPENGWTEGNENITDDMKKAKRKSLLNDYMLDLMEEGTYSVEAMEEKALELKESIS
ncbi:MAG: hypothetical protein PQJ59_01865 [Spirochaetales bacterium]|nr:hypothetical protein [Spirochaetales bacterium]